MKFVSSVIKSTHVHVVMQTVSFVWEDPMKCISLLPIPSLIPTR